MTPYSWRKIAGFVGMLSIALASAGTSLGGNCWQCPWKKQHHKRECFPCGPCWGYYPTCWRAWPGECLPCPPPDRVHWLDPAEELPAEPLHAPPVEETLPEAGPPPTASAERNVAPPARLRLERERRVREAHRGDASEGDLRSRPAPVVRSSRRMENEPVIEAGRPTAGVYEPR